MASLGFLLCLLLSYIQGSPAKIILTQTPDQISANPGDTVTMTCRCSPNSYGSSFQWYQKKPGHPPTLIIRGARTLYSGAPARFSGLWSGPEYTLKISGVKDEDEAVYYCQQGWDFPFTFGGGTRLDIKQSCGQMVITQTPETLSVSPGGTATILCKLSSGTDYLSWYQFKSGQSLKPLIYQTTNRFTGIPERFRGSRSGNDYTLTIDKVEEQDEAVYVCHYTGARPYTFGGGTRLDVKRAGTSTPTLSIFPPSPDQLKTTEATSVCLVKQFYPKGVTVAWKGDGTAITNRIDNSESTKDENNNYNLISTLTISTSDYKKYKEITCEVSHTTLSKALVESFQTAQCSP